MSERDNKEIPRQRAMVKDICFMVSGVAGKHFLYGFRRWFFNGFRLLQDRGCVSDGSRLKKTSKRNYLENAHARD